MEFDHVKNSLKVDDEGEALIFNLLWFSTISSGIVTKICLSLQN